MKKAFLLVIFFLAPAFILFPEKLPISIQHGESYSGNHPSLKRDREQIRSVFEYLVRATVEKDFSTLPEYILPKKGIYIDLKAWMDLKTLKNEIKKENSYFSIFFFDTEKLKKEKNSESVRTVRDLILLSEGLILDYHFESPMWVEVKIRFLNNRKFETEMNNPIFIKNKGKWYIYRLF